ncbi:MAG TPA: AMP-binding protein [Vicinamibacteria bacterium]|nr:AMP-binding protein [Vicinamibacteria bacterium]
MTESVVPPATADPAAIQDKVLEVVRALAAEAGGGRAARAASPEASLERDLGLGSLERVELLLRLETAFGRRLGEGALGIDTAAGLARALSEDAALPLSLPGAPESAALAGAVALPPPPTVHHALWARAQAEPTRPHVYLQEEDGSEHVVTYGRLLSESAAVAGGLRERGIRHGDTVALMLPTGFDFLRAFQGVLIAGAVPVPIYPPVRLDRLEEYAGRQSAILANAEVRALITVDRARGVAGLLRAAVPSLSRVTTAGDLAGLGASWGAPEGRGADAAFIQYTSGSTGAPKGVLLSHDNLLANIRAITAGLRAGPGDVGASWLPLYHDMGLIGSWLFCMQAGIPLDLLSPLAFLSRPERWLWAIHRRRATLSPAPNFAYELCLRRVPDRAIEGLDLSSWRCALNGAEPVSPDTLERFARRFAPYGFRREAMMPVYGLAENSVALAMPPPGRGPRLTRIAREPFERERRAVPAGDAGRALTFVSVGAPLPEHEVQITDDEGRALSDGHVGRLAFRGPSMMSGYYRQADATAAVTLAGGWLDSGDLAFRLDGELHIAGRRKDIIIKAGRNFVPQEIEEVAASVEGIRKGCVVALGVPHATLGTESLVVVAETRARDPEARDRLAATVTERVSAALGVPPDQVALVPPGAIPKTSSGKIRRAATRDLYLGGALGRRPPGHRLARARVVAGAVLAPVRRWLGTLARAVYAAYLAALAVPIVALLWPVAVLWPGRKAALACGRLGARMLLRLGGIRVAVEGLQSLPPAGPLVLASNHASYADVPVLMASLPAGFRFVAKKEVLRWPLVGRFVRKAGHLTVDRFDVRQGVADAAGVARALAAGEVVLFFPEGTFTAAAGMRPFRLGAFKAAAEAGVPVVPIAVRGTRQVLGVGGALPRPGRVRLWIGSPLRAEGEGWRGMVALRDLTADQIADRCGEPRLDLVGGGPVRP